MDSKEERERKRKRRERMDERIEDGIEAIGCMVGMPCTTIFELLFLPGEIRDWWHKRQIEKEERRKKRASFGRRDVDDEGDA